MKIAFDAKRAFSNSSGLGNYSRHIIQSMAKHSQHELYLFSTSNSSHLFDSQPYNLVQPEEPIDKILKGYWRSFSSAKEALRLNIDLYHGLSNELPFTLGKTCKTVVTIHDLIFKRYPQWYPFIDRKLYDWKFRAACQNADKIIAISEQTKHDIVHFYKIKPEKIEVIYQSCNDIFKTDCPLATQESVRKQYGLPPRFILNVGTIEERKNAFELVKAVHQHKIEIPLIIVGRSTPYAEKIQAYIEKHGLRQQVRLLHGVPSKDLPAFYQMADLFLYPSTFEGFGIPIIEALYSGTPVVSTQGGCFSEPGGPHTFYLESINPENIAHAINKILTDKPLAEKMIREGREYVRRFDNAVIEKKLLDLYRTCVAP